MRKLEADLKTAKAAQQAHRGRWSSVGWIARVECTVDLQDKDEKVKHQKLAAKEAAAEAERLATAHSVASSQVASTARAISELRDKIRKLEETLEREKGTQQACGTVVLFVTEQCEHHSMESRLQKQELEAEKAAALAERLKSEHSAAASEAMTGGERVRELELQQQRAVEALRVIGEAERHAPLTQGALSEETSYMRVGPPTTLMFGACDALTHANAYPATLLRLDVIGGRGGREGGGGS